MNKATPGTTRNTSRSAQWIPPIGQPLQLVFSVKALHSLKDRWGLRNESEVIERMQTLGEQLDISLIVDILFGLTRSFHPEVTPDQLLDQLDELGLGDLDGIAEIITKVTSAAMPPPPP